MAITLTVLLSLLGFGSFIKLLSTVGDRYKSGDDRVAQLIVTGYVITVVILSSLTLLR